MTQREVGNVRDTSEPDHRVPLVSLEAELPECEATDPVPHSDRTPIQGFHRAMNQKRLYQDVGWLGD